MSNHWEVPIFVGSFVLGLGGLVAIVCLAAHYGAMDTQACINLVKDKSVQDILLICKGR